MQKRIAINNALNKTANYSGNVYFGGGGEGKGEGSGEWRKMKETKVSMTRFEAIILREELATRLGAH